MGQVVEMPVCGSNADMNVFLKKEEMGSGESPQFVLTHHVLELQSYRCCCKQPTAQEDANSLPSKNAICEL